MKPFKIIRNFQNPSFDLSKFWPRVRNDSKLFQELVTECLVREIWIAVYAAVV